MSLLAALAATPAFAETEPTTATDVNRDVKQQQRIEQGLESGQLSTGEAARLEKGDSRIDAAESRAMKDGAVSAEEQARIDKMQDAQSQRIYNQKHDARVGNPNSASSQRMQNDVQRNINQEKRIDQGLESGTLTTEEAARLERGQAKSGRAEYRAGRDGHVGAAEQRRIHAKEKHQSHKIYRKKHNDKSVTPAPTEAPAAE
jgi:hypothetical protein